jgi:hypothetical protein
VAVVAGVGGGYAPAAGGFSALDVGAVVAYPNCTVVPFGNLTTFASVPLAAKQVDFRGPDGSLVASDKAGVTVGWGLGGGIELPLDRDRCRRGLTPPRLQLGVGANALYRTDGGKVNTTVSGDTTTTTQSGGVHEALGVAVGVEFPF